MPAELTETRYISEEEKYGLYNFHRRTSLEAVVRILTEPGPAPVLLLSGEAGSGRKYFLEAAAWQAGREGGRTIILPLDLEGFEDGPQGLVRFVDLWSKRRQEKTEALRSERLGFARKIAGSIPSSVPGAVLLSFLLEWKGPIDGLRSVLGESFEDLDGPHRNPRESVRLLFEAASRSACLVVHVVKSAQINKVLRRWLLEEAKRDPKEEARRNPSLVLAFSCDSKDEDEAVAPRAKILRLDFDPLTTAELHEVLDGTCYPHSFPPELADTLARYGRGLPSRIATKMKDLVQDEVVVLDGSERWRLGQAMNKEDFAKEFSVVLLEPVRDFLSELDLQIADRLERFLDLAALCGENVPAGLILAHIEVTELQRQEILDLIDEELVESEDKSIFVDHQYGHPSFPRILIYSFRSPIFTHGLVEYVPKGKRERLASDLLAFLRRRLAVTTKGIAHLFLNLTDYLESTEEREECLRELEWWIGQDEAEELSACVEIDLAERRISPEVVVDMVERCREKWLPSHRLALLTAVSRSVGGIPVGVLRNFHYLRALVLLDLGSYEEALEEGELALRFAEGTHRSRAAGLNLVGVVLHRLGRLEQACDKITDSLKISRRELGESSPTTAQCLHDLAGVLQDLGELRKARRLAEDAVSIHRNALGAKHLNTGHCLLALSSVLTESVDLNSAERVCKEALAIYRESLGEEHYYIANNQVLLAIIFQRTERSTEARTIMEQVFVKARTSLGETHPWAAGWLTYYADILADLDEVEKAQEVGERAVGLLRNTLGPDHYRLAKALRILGKIYGLVGEKEKSFQSYSEALAICNKAFRVHHPLTAEIRRLLQTVRLGEDPEYGPGSERSRRGNPG